MGHTPVTIVGMRCRSALEDAHASAGRGNRATRAGARVYPGAPGVLSLKRAVLQCRQVPAHLDPCEAPVVASRL
jgi:hypothetical protein